MGTLSGAVGEPSSVVHEVAGVVDPDVEMAVSPGEALDLTHPIGVGVVVHHALSFALVSGKLSPRFSHKFAEIRSLNLDA
jgi:hypothetical protein